MRHNILDDHARYYLGVVLNELIDVKLDFIRENKLLRLRVL
jgi:hypothetical protein